MVKRHRRTKAEMAIVKAEKAKKMAEKYQARVAKKQEQQNANVSAIVPLVNHTETCEDNKKYEFCEFTGTEQECVSFMKTHNYDWIGTSPYLYQGSTYRVTYWKEVE
jgi:hypothetical protein